MRRPTTALYLENDMIYIYIDFFFLRKIRNRYSSMAAAEATGWDIYRGIFGQDI